MCWSDSLSLHFNCHFSRWNWVSRYQNDSILDFIRLRMMETVVTTGVTRRAKLQSNCYCQQTNTQLSTGRMSFLLPTNSVKALKGVLIWLVVVIWLELGANFCTFQSSNWSLPPSLLSLEVAAVKSRMVWHCANGSQRLSWKPAIKQVQHLLHSAFETSHETANVRMCRLTGNSLH